MVLKPDEVWDSNLRLSDVGSNKKAWYSFNRLTNQGPGLEGLVTNLTIFQGSERYNILLSVVSWLVIL